VRPGSVLLDVERRPRFPRGSQGVSLGCRSPPSCDEGSSSPGAHPSQSVRFLLTSRLRRRFDSQRSRVPSTTSLGLAPWEPGCPDPARFRSQVFATSQRFPSTPELCGLVPCRCRPWDPSLQSFPLDEDRLPLSRPHAPLQSSTRVRRRTTQHRSPCGFTDFHAFARLPGSPSTMDFLSSGRGPPPGRPGSCAVNSPRSASFTCFEAFLPSPSPFAATSGCPGVAGRCSLGLPAPPKLSPPTPRILRPAQTRRSAHEPSSEDSGSRPEGPQPSRSGELPRASKSLESARRRLPASLEAGPHRLSAVAPSLMALGAPSRSSPSLTFRASKYVESGVSPRRSPAPLGFLASSPASWLRCLLESWLLPKDSPDAGAPVSGRSPCPSDPRRPLLTGHVAVVSA